MMKLIDTKIQSSTQSQEITPFEFFKNYFLSRDSSAVRIPLNSILVGTAGAFFGLAKALYKEVPQRPLIKSHGLGALGMGVLYYTVNEVANGIVRRSMDREQLFISNTAAGVVTNIATFLYLQQINQAKFFANFMRSIKFSWTLCLGSIMWDIYVVQIRHYFLVHGLDNYKKQSIKINRIPSDGTRWLRMKEIEKLREQANMERFGVPHLTKQIYQNRDNTLTYEEIQEQIKIHTEYLKSKNMLTEDYVDSSIFTKQTQSKQQPATTPEAEKTQQKEVKNSK
ncbi:hypothetical protein ABPG72_016053 [Tetrahymena utriculariae]